MSEIIDFNANELQRLAEAGQVGVNLTRANTIPPQPIDWLWNGWLARGKLHVLAEAPGTGKSNIGENSGGFRYDLEPCELDGYPGIHTTRFVWGEAVEGTARDLLGRAEAIVDPDERSALEDAKGFLKMVLADGPVSAKRIKIESDDAGHAWRTIRRAKDALGIEPRKESMKAGWMWAIPPEGGQKTPKGSTQKDGPLRQTLATFGEDAHDHATRPEVSR